MNTNTKIKTMRFIGMVLIAAILFTMPVFASANYGEQGGKWVLSQILWGALVIIAITLSKYLFKANFVQMLITGVVATLVVVIIDDPMKLKGIGTTIWTTVFGG